MSIPERIRKYFELTDRLLIALSVLAAAGGLLLVDSAAGGSPRMMVTQCVGIALGLAIMFTLSRIDYERMAKAWRVLAVVGVFFLALTIVIGSSRSGSQDRAWIRIGSNSIQPSEFIKIMFAITLSQHIDMVKEHLNRVRNVLLLTLHAMIPIGFLLIQRDMGMLLVFGLMFMCMMYAAGVQLRYFAVSGLAVFISAPVIWAKVLGATQKNRILSLFDPVRYAADAYQQTQGRLAIGSGGLLGEGLFRGHITQGIASLLPEKQNDMIFAVAGEELGFVGCLAILGLLLLFLLQLIRNARGAKDLLGYMIDIGIFASFAVQVGVNIAAALMLFPITGISLPFFSYGGTSIVSCFAAVGVVLSVHMHRGVSLFSEGTRKPAAV